MAGDRNLAVVVTANIKQMREQMAANQPVLDGIRTINGKLIWLIISAMATPAVVLAYMTSKLGGA
jgi:hypothetical protein